MARPDTISLPSRFDHWDEDRGWAPCRHHLEMVPAPDELLVETFAHDDRHHLVCYPFEGVLARGALAVLLTRRLSQRDLRPIGCTISDYAIYTPRAGRSTASTSISCRHPWGQPGDWLADSFMVKRSFHDCAKIAGLLTLLIATFGKVLFWHQSSRPALGNRLAIFDGFPRTVVIRKGHQAWTYTRPK